MARRVGKKIVIIGGGHNGLVCAAYLAGAGHQVRLLERRGVVGGAAVTEEFHPGFRNSVCSYTVSLLHPKVIKDLNLNKHGLTIVPRRMNNYLPLPDGDSLSVIPGKLEDEVRRLSPADVENLQLYERLLAAITPVIREAMLLTPPSLTGLSLPDVTAMLKLTRAFSRLNQGERQFLLNLFSRSAGEILDDLFESPALKALFGFDAVVGNYGSPYSAGSGYVLLHHLLGEIHGEVGLWGHAMGGMGSISEAIASEATALGAQISTHTSVEQVNFHQQRACGVRLANGDNIDADLVVSGINPTLLFQQMIEPELIEDDIHRHFREYKNQSGTFRMNVALQELPRFDARQVEHCLEAGIIMAPSLDYMDRAWQDARTHGWSRQPIVEMLIPSLIDSSLAPEGQHVASLFCQQFDPAIPGGWDLHREAAAEAVINTVNSHAPNFKNSIIGQQILSPLDLEREFGLVGGDIFHGRLSLEQLFSARPRLGMGHYRSGLAGLYLCGSGSHPGGGVSGIPGHNAAREILRDI